MLDLRRQFGGHRPVFPVDGIDIGSVRFKMLLVLSKPGKQFSFGKSLFPSSWGQSRSWNAFNPSFGAILAGVVSVTLDFALLTEHTGVLLPALSISPARGPRTVVSGSRHAVDNHRYLCVLLQSKERGCEASAV